MNIHVHHHHSWDEAPHEMMNLLSLILIKLEATMAAIDDLQAAVAQEDTVIDSAVTLINGIPALIAAAGTDPAKLQALQTDIQNKSQALAAAVANVPSSTTPPTTPAA
jgi:hypothetical protein